MNSIVLQYNKFFKYLENINSENLGLYFSFLLHFLLLISAIGLPNFFDKKPILLPTIIPIEIINVSDVTSLSKDSKDLKNDNIKQLKVKEKKFNSSDNQEIKKIEIKDNKKLKKDSDEKKIIPKDDIKIKEKKDVPIKLEKEKIDIKLENIESLPKIKIKPKIKPKSSVVENKKLQTKSDVSIKIKPEVKTKPEFSIASMLKDLRNEKSSIKIESEKQLDQEENINEIQDEASEYNTQLSISEIDLLRQQLSSCWNAPAGAVIEKGMLVKISAKLKQNRRIIDNSVRIIDTNIPKSNSFYGPITESAMRTLLNPECIPLKLPEDKYDLWRNLSITFDYSIMKGY